MKKVKYLLILKLGLVAAMISCSEESKVADNASGGSSATLESVLLESPPANAIAISGMRKTANPGDEVTFSGTLIGSKSIFMENRAVMVMGDPEKITACNLIPGDGCETPWDVCCDDPDVIKASIVTVQVVDENGKPLKSGLKGLGGMEELSAVTVTGIVANSSSASNMLVNATGIYVQPKS